MIGLLILLLVLLPLYLWPLRGGRGGLPRASALSGSPNDPRDPGAVARIPSDVWNALMARTGGPPPAPPKPPANLTMIAGLHEVGGAGSTHLPSIIEPPGSSPHRSLLELTDDGSPSSGGGSRPDDSSPGPMQFLASDTSNQGTGNGGGGFGSGGYPGFSNLGPWNGGGPGGPARGGAPSSGPGSSWDPDAPTPTPEPATLLLLGSNLALLGALSWRRLKRREETDSSG